ncbi:hypothetical protein Fmac_032767 [Flemingia macrophylla]|uniref:Homing endonuclease LAGLIDADG domain-containing protein n=1 Tax=Flemingia macrophylla TaxID=520843 RepID=A0ABD1L5V2_9FABA
MWESLIYESGIKKRLLRYAASALLFTEKGSHARYGYGRVVDWTRFDGYEDLLRKLEKMFDIKVVNFVALRGKFSSTLQKRRRSFHPIGIPIIEEVKPSKMDSKAIVNAKDQSSIVGLGY